MLKFAAILAAITCVAVSAQEFTVQDEGWQKILAKNVRDSQAPRGQQARGGLKG